MKQGAEVSLAGSPVTLTDVSWDIDAVGQNRDIVIHEFEPWILEILRYIRVAKAEFMMQQGAVIISILQFKKVKLRKIKLLAQGHLLSMQTVG